MALPQSLARSNDGLRAPVRYADVSEIWQFGRGDRSAQGSCVGWRTEPDILRLAADHLLLVSMSSDRYAEASVRPSGSSGQPRSLARRIPLNCQRASGAKKLR
jgi:hypothetical protein